MQKYIYLLSTLITFTLIGMLIYTKYYEQGVKNDICFYNNEFYAKNESFNDIDGCNLCTCGEGGNVACTKKQCLDQSTKETTCIHNGVGYGTWDKIDLDDCNSCTCLPSGEVACTTVACE